MKIIPLIYIQKRKLYGSKNTNPLSLTELLERLDTDTDLFIFDTDGILNNKPNLCTFPKLAEKLTVWMDSGPRDLGDVVDAVMTGVKNIVLRGDIWPQANIGQIQELTECKIYTTMPPESLPHHQVDYSVEDKGDGIIIHSERGLIEKDFMFKEAIKRTCTACPVGVVDSDEKNISYWKTIGTSILFMDYNTWLRANKNGL